MATAFANKPAPPHQKMKRPPPPTVQTNMNGTKSSHSPPSPPLSFKGPPSASIHPPPTANLAGANGINGNVGGVAARFNNKRRDSQKPSDIQVRLGRSSKGGMGDNVLDRRKKLAEPYGMRPWDSDKLPALIALLSQIAILYPQKVQEQASIPYHTSPSDLLPL